MNMWSVTGNLGRDAEVRYLPSGQAVCDCNVAVKSGFGKNEQTVWVQATLWGKRAEGDFPQYLTKGKQVAISGELSLNEWTTKEGDKRTTVRLNIADIELLGKKGDDNGQAPQQSEPQQAPDKPADFDDDVPF